MINSLFKGLTRIFGNKSDRDIKNAYPQVDEINQYVESYSSLDNDALRGKTLAFIERIGEKLKDIDEEIDTIKAEINSLSEDDVDQKDQLFREIEELEKRRNERLEVILEELLPEAFAVVKETAKRFTENETLVVNATDLDKELAVKKGNVTIQGTSAIYANEWIAAGGKIKWNMVHYDVQLIGGIALHKGKIAEMATGEGKTLVSTLPAYLNALAKRGVHVVTVNDYLARRDCEWNGPIFNFLGLSVDCIDYYQPNSAERRNAYKADITYGTNNEFGFDYLRDNMAHDPEELVQRVHHFAMIDEVDSVLIDDARTPLIISGPTPKGDVQEFASLKPRIQKLVEAQKKYVNSALSEAKKLIPEGNTGYKEGEGGLMLFRAFRGLPKNRAIIKYLGEQGVRSVLTKTESHYLQDNQKEMPKADEPLYFIIDEKSNSVDLTDRGSELITEQGEDPHFFILPDVGSELAEIEKSDKNDEEKRKLKEELMRDFAVKSDRIHSVQQLLKAYTLFEKDVEYIIQDAKVKIVDEQTGRIMEGRRYSDGLHQAIEAKENVKVEAATQTYATISLQNYFRMYHKLAGMTGTAETEAQELWDIYKLDVMSIPTNKPIVRKDHDDLVYKSTKEKFNAVIDEIVNLTSKGRPVLVGTTSVEISELLSRMLKFRNIKHNVLNAKQHQREAEIVAEAGKPGAVTIATNMAGRGTDIKITEEVREAGGLAIIGTERHESRRVDRQLRGRAGRQGDPGTSQFYVSLEDDLMRIFGSERVSKWMDRFGYKEGEVIQHPWMSKTIERNQKRVEQNNYGVRKRLLEFDDVMNKQRNAIYSRRRNALFGDKLSIDIKVMLLDWCQNAVSEFKETDDYLGLEMQVIKTLACDLPFDEEEFKSSKDEILVDQLFDYLSHQYRDKAKRLAASSLPVFKHIKETQGSHIEFVVVPFTDGTHIFQLQISMNQVLQSNGEALFKEMEKIATLQTIDDEWKEHLRELDDLKQASYNAAIEQKDPLLIYKIESYKLFEGMMNRLAEQILGLLYRVEIAADEQTVQGRSAPAPKREQPKVKTGREELVKEPVFNQEGMPVEHEPQRVQQAPIVNELKIGRNDPCPCGSGKKYKNCHGKES